MGRWNPCKRSDFIRRLRRLGFDGPFSGSKHHFLVFEQCRLTVPLNDEYSVPQLRMMLREAEAIIGREISSEEWNKIG